VVRDQDGTMYSPSVPLLLRLRVDGLPIVYSGTVAGTQGGRPVLRITSITPASRR
jgi:hypothetical protein